MGKTISAVDTNKDLADVVCALGKTSRKCCVAIKGLLEAAIADLAKGELFDGADKISSAVHLEMDTNYENYEETITLLLCAEKLYLITGKGSCH